MNNNMNFAEFFSGASGLGEGFISEGFNPIATVEVNKHCCETLKTRSAYHYLMNNNNADTYNDYLKGKIDKDALYSQIPKEVLSQTIHQEINADNMEGIKDSIREQLGSQKLDVILGGPPCQAYSIIGKFKNGYKANDHRLYLYKFYISFLKEFQPKIFLFENVLGLLSLNKGNLFNTIKQEFEKAGYNIAYKVLDASQYGVLQKRKRVILIGIKKYLAIEFNFDLILEEKNQYLVKDLLQDLPKLRTGKYSKKYATETNDYLKKFNIRNEQDNILTCHQSRPHNERDLEIYKIVVQAWNSSKERLKYSKLPSELITHKNIKSFLDRFKVVAGNMPYSHTMVAHIAKDGHHYIHPDIQQNRSLTVREAARIQSFPDNYFFEGPRTAQFTQVGNAVPPILSRALAKQIRKLL